MAQLIKNEVGLPFSNMEKSQTPGRILVAISLIVFGVQHFMYGGFVAGLVPAFMPGRLFWAYLIGVILVAIGAAIVLGKKTRMAATALGTILFLFFLFVHAPRIVMQLDNPGPWTNGFEILALSGCALVLASSSPKENG